MIKYAQCQKIGLQKNWMKYAQYVKYVLADELHGMCTICQKWAYSSKNCDEICSIHKKTGLKKNFDEICIICQMWVYRRILMKYAQYVKNGLAEEL